MASTARLELRIAADEKALIERAAGLTNQSITAFATAVLVARASEIVEGPSPGRSVQERPVGGWTFPLPEDWDAPLPDLADYR